MFSLNKKTQMPELESALPGREDVMAVTNTNYVTGNSMQPPFPEGFEIYLQ